MYIVIGLFVIALINLIATGKPIFIVPVLVVPGFLRLITAGYSAVHSEHMFHMYGAAFVVFLLMLLVSKGKRLYFFGGIIACLICFAVVVPDFERPVSNPFSERGRLSCVKTFSGAYEMYCLDFKVNLNELSFDREFLEDLKQKGYLQSLPNEEILAIIEKHHVTATKTFVEVYEAIYKYNSDQKTYLWPEGSSIERDTVVALHKEGYLPQLPDEVVMRIIEGLPLDASVYSRFEELKVIVESRAEALIPKPERQYTLPIPETEKWMATGK